MLVWNKLASCLAGGRGALRLFVVAGFVGVALSTGCGEVTTTPVDTATPTPETVAPQTNGDDLDLSRVTNFILPNAPGVNPDKVRGAEITAKITAASTDGQNLRTSYEKYSFPSESGTDAIAYFFYEYNGTVMGGKFDWWRTGGQGLKGLENVHAGYGGHKMPASGTACWTMFGSIDGGQRSNTRVVIWN